MSNGMHFLGSDKVCSDSDLEKEKMPFWTRKAIEQIWQKVLTDVAASKANTKNIMWTSTQCLLHVVSEMNERCHIQ